MRYAYLGPEGTFSEAAVARLAEAGRRLEGEVEPVPCATIGATLDAVRTGAAERAVVPIESSVEGIVTATVDDLAGGDLLIVGETRLPDRVRAAGQGRRHAGGREDGRRSPAGRGAVQALAGGEPAGREWVPFASNAEAARRAGEGDLDAALASAGAASRYGLTVLAPNVHDRSNAVTRFVEVGPAGSLPARPGSDRTSVAAFLGDDHAGALMLILTEFAVRGINLSTIQSRPTGDGLGSYFFFIDCEGHIDDARVGEAMMGVRRVCAEVRFLGSYPRTDRGKPRSGRGTTDAEFADAAAWLAPAEVRPDLAAPGGRVGLEFGLEFEVGLGCEQVRQSKVGARASERLLLLVLRGHQTRRERAAHLLELGAGGHLLGEQRGLDAVKRPRASRPAGPAPPGAPPRSACRPRTAATAARARRRVRARARPRAP